jgi:hypothetical protein
MSGAGGLSFRGACLFAAAASAGSDAPRTETFTGFKASDNYSSGYVGGSYALSKTGLYEPGFRLRAVGAYGRYHYDGTLPGDDGEVPVTFDGEDAFLSALVRLSVPAWTAHRQALRRDRGRGSAYRPARPA